MTHVVNSDHGLLLYRQTDGIACTGQFNRSGKLVLTGNLCANAPGPGWTHVVSLGENIVFYNAASGAAKVGTLNAAGAFRWLSSFTAGTGFTHVVNTPNGMVFYNNANGAIVIGQFDLLGRYKRTYIVSSLPAAVGFNKIYVAQNNRLLFYGGGGSNGSFVALVDSNGKIASSEHQNWVWDQYILLGVDQWVLAYNPAVDGGIFNFPRGVMSYMDAAGNMNSMGQWFAFSANWTHLVTSGGYVLFYASNTGDFAVGHFDPSVVDGIDNPNNPPWGWVMELKFVQTQGAAALFSLGWTDIISTN